MSKTGKHVPLQKLDDYSWKIPEKYKRGMVVRSASQVVLAEEAAGAYKDVDKVAEVSDKLGIANKVVRLLPLAVIKG
jgi:tRNA-splicing ligase RtcB